METLFREQNGREITLSNVSKKNERKTTGVKEKLPNDQMGDILC